MLTIKYETTFKKDYKRIVKRGYNTKLLENVIEILASGQPLPDRYRDHALIGEYADCRECHITPDWLLIYQISNDELILFLTRTGSHSDLFWSCTQTGFFAGFIFVRSFQIPTSLRIGVLSRKCGNRGARTR